MKLGRTITDIRKERGMTQEDFAKIFHVTRQTVSNWEKEKSYPDLQTLVNISDEFGISLDTMLKEDQPMITKISKDIKFGRNLRLALIGCASAVIAAGTIWALIWNNARNITEQKFQNGIEDHDFSYNDTLGYYTKTVDSHTYYALPNQKMPGYFDFSLDFHAKQLECITKNGNQSFWIRRADNNIVDIYYLDESDTIGSQLTQKEIHQLAKNNPQISALVANAELIYDSVYR